MSEKYLCSYKLILYRILIRENANMDEFSFYYYDFDHLGNVRQVTEVDGSPKGRVVQTNNYYPFGMQFCDGTKNYLDQKHKYNGKEFDNMYGLNTYDYGARQYNPVTLRWDRVDPMCEEDYGTSPYVYCANDPIKHVDPDGRKVRPCKKSFDIIKNTLPLDARQYVSIDENGYIDVSLLNQYTGESGNFNSLKTLAESSMDISVTSLQQTQYLYKGEFFTEYFKPVTIDNEFVDSEFKSCSGNTTGECGNLGVTYMSTSDMDGKAYAKEPSSIHININPSLSKIGAAETFSHEGYGHALIYVQTNGNRTQAIHHFNNSVETNIELITKSINARVETIKNIMK